MYCTTLWSLRHTFCTFRCYSICNTNGRAKNCNQLYCACLTSDKNLCAHLEQYSVSAVLSEVTSTCVLILSSTVWVLCCQKWQEPVCSSWAVQCECCVVTTYWIPAVNKRVWIRKYSPVLHNPHYMWLFYWRSVELLGYILVMWSGQEVVAELEVNSASLQFELLELYKLFRSQLFHKGKVTWLAGRMNWLHMCG